MPTKCLTAEETRLAYLLLAASGRCGEDEACLLDTCPHCAALNALIEERGEECAGRGCTVGRCIYDD